LDTEVSKKDTDPDETISDRDILRQISF
jgi:hypothetical protein